MVEGPIWIPVLFPSRAPLICSVRGRASKARPAHRCGLRAEHRSRRAGYCRRADSGHSPDRDVTARPSTRSIIGGFDPLFRWRAQLCDQERHRGDEPGHHLTIHVFLDRPPPGGFAGGVLLTSLAPDRPCPSHHMVGQGQKATNWIFGIPLVLSHEAGRSSCTNWQITSKY